MNILLLGGTGAMGRYLAQILSNNSENKIYITSRQDIISQGNITYIKGDAHSDNFIQNIFQKYGKFDAIVDFMVYKTEEFKRKVNLLTSITNQYLFLSSARVYANGENSPITEETPRLLDVSTDEKFLATDEYPLTKARQEDILYANSKCNYTIIRPYITYGTYRLQLGVLEKEFWLQRALAGHTIYFSKDIAEHITTLTYGKDVAKIISLLIGNPKAYNETVQIASNKSICWSEILSLYENILAKYTGTSPKIYLDDDIESFITGYFAKYPIYYDRLYDRRFDSNKVNSIIGFNYNYLDATKGLKNCLLEFLENPKFLSPMGGHFDAWADKKAGNKMQLKDFPSAKDYAKYFIKRNTNACEILARKYEIV